MEPTDFEKWCAGEFHVPVSIVTNLRIEHQNGNCTYKHLGIANRYRAYMAGVRSRLPYQTPPKGDEDEG